METINWNYIQIKYNSHELGKKKKEKKKTVLCMKSHSKTDCFCSKDNFIEKHMNALVFTPYGLRVNIRYIRFS